MRPAFAAILASMRSAAVLASAAGPATAMILRCSPAAISELSPASAVALQQLLGSGRALAAGLVVFETLGAGLVPGIKKRLHCLPAGLHAIGALKQNVVADHAVVDH